MLQGMRKMTQESREKLENLEREALEELSNVRVVLEMKQACLFSAGCLLVPCPRQHTQQLFTSMHRAAGEEGGPTLDAGQHRVLQQGRAGATPESSELRSGEHTACRHADLHHSMLPCARKGEPDADSAPAFAV